jgi:hypothetical protein
MGWRSDRYRRRMESGDRIVRNATYGQIPVLGRVPTSNDVAALVGRSAAAVRSSWRRLHDEHAIVLDPATDEIRMAHPFSAVPTPFRVRAVGVDWYANCAWDACGICAALGVDGAIDTSCPDCGDPIRCAVHDRAPDDPTLVFHCLVPAAAWWDDIVFT